MDRRKKKLKQPTEDSEQRALVAALRRAELYFIHVPMGGSRDRKSGQAMRNLGARKGFPDLLIFDTPAARRWTVLDGRYQQPAGAAIELKRQSGGKVSREQRRELEQLEARGWLTAVCHGCEAALRQLREWGYEV